VTLFLAYQAGTVRAVPKDKNSAVLMIPSLDGLRAVSFMLVFLGHVGTPGVPGGFGVTVFFFLSGYLITTLLRLEVERTGTVSLRHFYLRRALRIWPPFYLVLLIAYAISFVLFPEGLRLAPFLAQALHYSNYQLIYQGWDGVAAGTGVYWSLAVEEHFYLLFPAFYLLLHRFGVNGVRQRTIFFGLCAAALLWRIVLVTLWPSSSDRTYLGSDTRVDSMLFGCCLAVAGNPMFDLEKRDRPSRSDLGWLAAGLGALLTSFVYRDGTFRETLRYTLQGLGLYPLFIVAVRSPNWGPFRFLNLKPVKFVGALSYSLYLVHQIVIMILLEHFRWPNLIGGPIALVLSFACAYAIYLFVEQPFAALRKRMAHGVRTPKPGDATVLSKPASP
jgi:peptidoglycan/LPS O-acetylase OafA/YrhL